MSDNQKKALWDRVKVTDPKAVKAITGKQYQGNSPRPYWIVERLTEEFGPCGIGWGFSIINERMERLTESEILHVAVVKFWYVLDGIRGELEQIGQTKCVYEKSKGGLMVDEDAPKKSVTDALVKCASYIGFAGDIFSGRWDDSKYVNWARAQYAEPPAAPKHSPTGDPVIDEHRRSVIVDTAESIKDHYDRDDVIGAYEDATGITDSEEKTALWKLLPSNIRSALKKHAETLKEPA